VREVFDNGTGTVVGLVTLNAERNGEQQSHDSVQVWLPTLSAWRSGRPASGRPRAR
jgi:hypothetical protein